MLCFATMAFGQYVPPPAGACSQMNTPTVGSTVSNYQNCTPHSPGIGLYDIYTFNLTTHTQFWCVNTSTGNTYFGPLDSFVTASGQCITNATSYANCNPIDRSYVTYAQYAGDYNRYYHVLTNVAINPYYSPPACQEQGGGWNQDFLQCVGQFGRQCSGGGGGQNCGSGNVTPYQPPPDDGGTGGTGACSPIIIDVEGQGFHLTSARNGVLFDITASGHPLQIGWTDPHYQNGFLVLDRNDNGRIDDGSELFGNFTAQPKSDHPNGFAALALYDLPMNGGNGDGIIDKNDSIYATLRIWIDENHDGISQPNELHTLPELGVESLDLKYTESRRVDEFGNGFRYKARVNKKAAGGAEASEVGHWAYDVFFTTK